MVHNVMVMIHTVVMVTRMCQLNMNFSLKSLNLPQTPDHNVMEWPQGARIFRGPRNGNTKCARQKTQKGREWTSTPQCTNVDGWCTDWILFSIPVPSQVDFFCLPFFSPDHSFFLQLYFLPAPHPVSFYFSFCFWDFSHQPTTPHCPPPTYSPLYLN
jgi:hypothetical protein